METNACLLWLSRGLLIHECRADGPVVVVSAPGSRVGAGTIVTVGPKEVSSFIVLSLDSFKLDAHALKGHPRHLLCE